MVNMRSSARMNFRSGTVYTVKPQGEKWEYSVHITTITYMANNAEAPDQPYV